MASETSPILPGQTQPPSRVTSAHSQDGEQAFHDLAKTKGNTKDDIDFATRERTRITRLSRTNISKGSKVGSTSSHANEAEIEAENEYYTVIDPTTGQVITLRLLAIA